MNKYGEIPANIIEQLTKSIPVIEMSHREDAWRYIGLNMLMDQPNGILMLKHNI